MVHFGKSSRDKNPVWYKTWWIVLFAIYFVLAGGFLIWADRVKPEWLKIEVSNCDVALLSAAFTYLFLGSFRVKSKIVKFIFGLLWLLFLPNTAYLFSDLGHLPYQWTYAVTSFGRLSLLVQYILLELFALTVFLYSCLPFEKIVDRINVFRKRKVLWLTLFNFIVAYGMVLGRFQHINSWILLSHPLRVLESAIGIFVSFDLLGLTFSFGLLCNIIYFLSRLWLLQRTRDANA